MFGSGLPGLLAGLGAFSFTGLLVGFAESKGCCCLRADGLFCTFIQAAVVVGLARISKMLTTSCHAGWQMQG